MHQWDTLTQRAAQYIDGYWLFACEAEFKYCSTLVFRCPKIQVHVIANFETCSDGFRLWPLFFEFPSVLYSSSRFIERVLKVSGQNSPPMFVLVVIAWPINGIWTRFSLVFVLTRCKPTAQMFDVISEAFKHLLKYCPSLVAQRPGFVMPLQDLRSSFAKRNIVLDEGELFEDGEWWTRKFFNSQYWLHGLCPLLGFLVWSDRSYAFVHCQPMKSLSVFGRSDWQQASIEETVLLPGSFFWRVVQNAWQRLLHAGYTSGWAIHRYAD